MFQSSDNKTKENIYGEEVKVEVEEFDEDHALDLVMNDMVEDLTEEDLEVGEVEVKVEEVEVEEVEEPKQEKPVATYKDPSQLSSYRRRKIEEEGKRYW